jgi:hypothetical protein
MPNSAVILVLLIEWAPIVDALATILIIPSYRNSLMFWRPEKITVITRQNLSVIHNSKSQRIVKPIPITVIPVKRSSVEVY